MLSLAPAKVKERKVLTAGYAALAVQLQEAAGDLTASDTGRLLSGAVRDAHRGSGSYGYYLDHNGDDQSGDVMFSSGGDTYAAPYEIEKNGDSAACCNVDMESKRKVQPRTVYEDEPDEADHYSSMEESLKAEGLYTELPLYERFISKNERDNADASDFAGKGKSFPILKPGDIMAAVRSMGRAGSSNLGPSGIKARIISIAKRKGWTKYLPKAWQGDGGKESAKGTRAPDELALIESAATLIEVTGTLREAAAAGIIPIKLISPGKGSTAYYTAEVLKKAAEAKIFKAGTPMRIDHPTEAEEAARPEGSVKDWGAVLASDAVWKDSHITPSGKDAGPGLYSEVKPFSDHATTITEKGPYAGVSICANGSAVTESGKPVMREGVPLLKEFTSAQGVDMVTQAGRGGMFLTEAAKPANPNQGGAVDMDQAAVQQLIESAVKAAQAPLLERALRGDAREEAHRILKTTSLIEAARDRVIESVMRDIPTKDGALDKEAFAKRVDEAAKTEGAYVAALTGSGRVTGMGAPVVEIDAKEAERQAANSKKLRESRVRAYMDLGMPKAAAEKAADRDTNEEAA